MSSIAYPGIGGTATLFTTAVDVVLGGGVKVGGTPASPEQLVALEAHYGADWRDLLALAAALE